jgi:hypothetical protein
MDCSSLPEFLEGDLPPGAQAQFEQHLVECAACQAASEAALQMRALGEELAQRPDRPHAVAPPVAPRRARRWPVGAAAVALAAVVALVVFWRRDPAFDPDRQLAGELAAHRTRMERLPYAPLDRHRDLEVMRAGPSQGGPVPTEIWMRPGAGSSSGDRISIATLGELERHHEGVALIAALIARGDLTEAASRLQHAGPGNDLDVERALVAERNGQASAALTLLDQVLARAPRHAQALWNRAVALADLDLPLAAAEAFDACAALGEPGWRDEAAQMRDALRSGENARLSELKEAVKTCKQMYDGTPPALDFVRRHAALCRPSIYVAVREARTRDDLLRLLPVARILDEVAGNTAATDLVNRIAAQDFQRRAPGIELYRRLRARPAPPLAEQARIVEQLRASGLRDLLLGALLNVKLPRAGFIDELVGLARADHDPYLEEIAIEYDATAKEASGHAIEAEASLRQAVQQCAARDVELRCTYLQAALVELYLARHRPTDATEVARAALGRSQRAGNYWDERALFGYLGQAAQLQRDYALMRAYIREPALRVDDCWQTLVDQEALAGAELSELRLARARAELDRAPRCDRPLSLTRAQIEAELARSAATPARIAELRGELDRVRQSELAPGARARVDAIEGRALAATDPAAARAALDRAIAAADALPVDDVEATKARDLAYRTLLGLGAADRTADQQLHLFAAAGRAALRDGCALGAMIDGERLLLIARDAAGKLVQVSDPHAFKTPDFDARTLVPASVVNALAGCPRVDVLALAPLYGQPQLLPAELAWSYRGPAGAPTAAGAPRPSVLVIEDARPPATLGLPALHSPSHEPREAGVGVVSLAGAEATPRRVRDALARTDFAEIHAHGFVDLGISDVSLIALSPDADGSFALTARVIAGLKLPRAPFVALAACDAAYTAPYLHQPWSLPYAFLLAGARGVLAPATRIPDQEAGGFFRAVGDQILRGIDPAVVLRDQRLARRGLPTDWVNSVVLFD